MRIQIDTGNEHVSKEGGCKNGAISAISVRKEKKTPQKKERVFIWQIYLAFERAEVFLFF